MTVLQCEERVFEVAGIEFAAKYWRPTQDPANALSCSQTSAKQRVIALHGWLDNCASFDFLAPHLEAEVLCIDLAGHGLSGFRQHLGAYNVWLDIPEVLAIAEQMQWSTFDVLAHSRGACIGYLLASCYPAKVTRLLALDGLFPLIAPAHKARDQLIQSLSTIKKQLTKKPSVYATRDAAIEARAGGMFSVTREEAAALAARSLLPVAGGFSWRYDPKVNAPSEVRLTMEQVLTFGEGISAPIHVFMAEDGMLINNDDVQALLARFPDWYRHSLAGGHHFHMSEQGEAIANTLNALWRKQT